MFTPNIERQLGKLLQFIGSGYSAFFLVIFVVVLGADVYLKDFGGERPLFLFGCLFAGAVLFLLGLLGAWMERHAKHRTHP